MACAQSKDIIHPVGFENQNLINRSGEYLIDKGSTTLHGVLP
jgi:hypothetical protein